jgi:hypothetical protein
MPWKLIESDNGDLTNEDIVLFFGTIEVATNTLSEPAKKQRDKAWVNCQREEREKISLGAIWKLIETDDGDFTDSEMLALCAHFNIIISELHRVSENLHKNWDRMWDNYQKANEQRTQT